LRFHAFLLYLSFQGNHLTREHDPPVQSRGAFLAAAARPDSGGVTDAPDDIAQADFLVANEPRQANPKRFAL
jgi:hypothetical protein